MYVGLYRAQVVEIRFSVEFFTESNKALPEIDNVHRNLVVVCAVDDVADVVVIVGVVFDCANNNTLESLVIKAEDEILDFFCIFSFHNFEVFNVNTNVLFVGTKVLKCIDIYKYFVLICIYI